MSSNLSDIDIENVFSITPQTEDIFFDVWDNEQGVFDASKAKELKEKYLAAEMIRVDHAGQPYTPDPEQYPNVELWLWADQSDPTNTDKMIGLYVETQPKVGGEFIETPIKWIVGKEASAMVVYARTCSCCPERSAVLFGSFEDGFDFETRDSARASEQHNKAFDNITYHDGDGRVLAHDYGHIVHKDRTCNHSHKPTVG